MPLTEFSSLPDDARCWVFGARAPLDDVDGPRLLSAVDRYLKQWKAHGNPLVCAREFRDEHFLVIGVDERASDASGCSIDGLFRVLQDVEKGIGTTMVGGGLVHFRDAGGMVHCVARADFAVMAQDGDVGAETSVFDLTVTNVGDYRARFEARAADTWHKSLLG
ncbi:MAG: hypothetical protein KF709_07770 [Gemmatimonadaceae bacterium]|nr:hypothetical protein [Gemmatimonadaceae bacterium]